MVARNRLLIDIIARDGVTRNVKSIQSTIIRFVGAVSASLAALNAIAFPITQAREFEKELRNVQKTTGFADQEIKILSADLLQLAANTGVASSELAKIAAAAGQLGLGGAGTEAITQFTESIARASITLDLTADKAATSFAKIGSIFGVPIQQTENLISTINELSNTTVATADQLIDIVQRIGPIAGEFEDVAALAAQALQLGLSPETAGTSIVKIFSRFESEADKFAEAFGVTVGDFLGKSTVERWKFYLTELSKLSTEESAKLINELSGSGRIFALVSKQVQDAANGFEIFAAAQANARRAFVEGTSAIEEYEKVSQSLDVQFRKLKETFRANAIEVGLALVPQLIRVSQNLREFLESDRADAFFARFTDFLESAITKLADFTENFEENWNRILRVLQAVGAVIGTLFLRRLGLGLVNLVAQFRAFTTAAGAAATGATALTGILPRLAGAFRLLWSALLGPIGIAITLLLTLFGPDILNVIKTFIGSVEKETALLNDLLRQRAGEAQAILDRQLAQYEALADRVAGGFDLTVEAVDLDGTESLTEFNEVLSKSTSQIIEFSEAQDAAQTVTAKLGFEQRKLAKEAEELRAQYIELENATPGSGDTALRSLSLIIDRMNEIEEETAEAELLIKKLDLSIQQAGQNAAAGFTLEVKVAAASLLDIRNIEERTANVNKALDALGQIRVEPEIVTDVDRFETAREAINVALQPIGIDVNDVVPEDLATRSAELTRQLTSDLEDLKDEARAAQIEYSRIVGDLTGTGLQQLQAAQLEELNARQLATVLEIVDANEQSEKAEAAITREKRAQAAAALERLFREEVLNEELTEQKENFDKLKKAAQGVFDNTIKEVRSLNVAFEEQISNIRNILATREETLRIEQQIARINEDISAASEREKDILDELAEYEGRRLSASEVYERNKLRAELSEVRSLRLVQEGVRLDALRNQGLQQVENTSGRIVELSREALAAAGRGDITGYTALKRQLDQQLKDGTEIAAELAEQRDPEGNLLFQRSDIESLLFALEQGKRIVTDTIVEGNQAQLDAVEKQGLEIAAKLKESADRLLEARAVVDDLGKLFPGLQSAIGTLRDTWANENPRFLASVRELGQIVDNSILGGRGLPESFAQDVDRLITDPFDEGADKVFQAITDGGQVLANSVRESIFGTGVEDALGPTLEDRQARDEINSQFEQLGDAASDAAVELRAISDVTPEAGLRGVRPDAETLELFQRRAAENIADRTLTEQARAQGKEFAKEALQGRDPGDFALPTGDRDRAAQEEAARQFGRLMGRGFLDELGVGTVQDLGSRFADAFFGFLPGGSVLQGVQRNAKGGAISGPGTGTSDSILSWLSNGEHVIDAKTAGTFGHGFFYMLQSMARGRGSMLSSFKRGLPAYASGGAVAGGEGSLAPVNINIPGMGSFPMLSRESTLDELQRAISRESLKKGTKGNR